jgi:SagB-type dehydrogenase family enzyme
MLHANERPETSALLHDKATLPATQQDVIKLPTPETRRGKPLMQAMQERHTTREFSDMTLSPSVLSNLLWAAVGVNRSQTGGRTAPSAHEWHEIDVYVASANGLYLYDARNHALRPILTEDIRMQTGVQAFVGDAPVNLVYVADHSRMIEAEETDRILYSSADVGAISQNVSLFCASEGLATVVRGMVARNALAKLMKLRPSQRVVLAQSIGFPARRE